MKKYMKKFIYYLISILIKCSLIKRLFVLSNKFISLFNTKDVIYLFKLMFSLYLLEVFIEIIIYRFNFIKMLFIYLKLFIFSNIGSTFKLHFCDIFEIILDLCKFHFCDILFGAYEIWKTAFVSLFDVDLASRNPITLIMFTIVWLVGGGALVSVMVGQYNKNINGEFRLWPCLIDNHIVVLGWDNGVLTQLVSLLKEDHKRDCFVITSGSVIEVEKLFESANIDKTRVYIYKGDYDYKKEWKRNLSIRKADIIYIMGECDENAHDSRVRILYNEVCRYKNNDAIVKVNIHDFGLARELIIDNKENSQHIYENFHLRWASELCKSLRPKDQDLSIFIVGFGAMGKAIALKAIEQSERINIFVSDDDEKKLDEEQKRFKLQFDNEEKYTKPITFIKDWKFFLDAYINDEKGKKAFVVAKKRSEKGMLCLMDIIKHLKNVENVQLFALNQEVDGYSVNSEDILIKNYNVKIFGIKKGCKWDEPLC